MALDKAPYAPRYNYDRSNGERVQYGWQLLDYEGWNEGTEWRPNTPFEATLVLVGTERGRSAARFIWMDPATNTRYPMFMSGMQALVFNHRIDHGEVTATWHVVKRGSNYGLEAVA